MKTIIESMILTVLVVFGIWLISQTDKLLSIAAVGLLIVCIVLLIKICRKASVYRVE